MYVALPSLVSGSTELVFTIQSEAFAGPAVQLEATALTADRGRGVEEFCSSCFCPRASQGSAHATYTASTKTTRVSGRAVSPVRQRWFSQLMWLPLPLPPPRTLPLSLSRFLLPPLLLSLLLFLPPFRIPLSLAETWCLLAPASDSTREQPEEATGRGGCIATARRLCRMAVVRRRRR